MNALKPVMSRPTQRRRRPDRTAIKLKDYELSYKYPRNVWFVDALPKEPTGMILNREIRRP